VTNAPARPRLRPGLAESTSTPQDIGSNITTRTSTLGLGIEGHMDISIVHLSGRFG